MENSPQTESGPQKLDTALEPLLEMNRQQIIESIEKEGVEASLEMMGKWCDKVEKWVEENPLNKEQITRRMVIVNFAKYDFYLAAGDMPGAIECLEDAIYMAEKEGHLDLKLKILERLKPASEAKEGK